MPVTVEQLQGITVRNSQGTVVSGAAAVQLLAPYGLEVRRAPAAPGQKVWRLVELREDRSGTIALGVTTRDEAGALKPGVRVARHWPSAPNQLPADVGSRWKNNAIVADTKADADKFGMIDFAMGENDDFPVGWGGVSAIWIAGHEPSDLVDKLGWIGGTNHDHFDAVFQLMNSGPVQPPQEIRFDRIVRVLEKAARSLQNQGLQAEQRYVLEHYVADAVRQRDT